MPPFNSKEFTAFADDLGFKHRKVTPKWARANGEVEKFLRTVKKVIKISDDADIRQRDQAAKAKMKEHADN